MATERPQHDPAQDSSPETFAKLLKTLRKNAGGLSQRQAAIKADVSQPRWAQVERGYVRGPGDATAAGPDFVVKVAEAFHQDPVALLRLAGHDPAKITIEPKPDVPPSALMELWPDLNSNQRLALVLQARLMAYPDAVVSWSTLLGDLREQEQPSEGRVVTGADVTSAESRRH